MPQETFLFSEYPEHWAPWGRTTRSNRTKKPVRRILSEQCARIARVEDDILEFPKGYDTLLGEKGVNLSGGQKQRVAIARAIARKPAILLLDDCLSAVDTETEEAILKGLKDFMKSCTTLIVSHRVSTVEHADEILVMDQGRIAERGRHEELLQKKGYYAELHEKQQLEEALDEAD